MAKRNRHTSYITVFAAIGSITYGKIGQASLRLHNRLTRAQRLRCEYHWPSHWTASILQLFRPCAERSWSVSDKYNPRSITPILLPHFSLSPYTNTDAGAMNGLFFAGGALGSLSIAYTASAYGRLRTIQIACLVCILGAALMAGAANVAMYLASRFIMGWGVGQMVCGGNPQMLLRIWRRLTNHSTTLSSRALST